MNADSVQLARFTTAIALAGILIYFAAMLVPPYFQNSRFQSFLESAIARTSSPEILKAEILSEAAHLGLPLREGNVRILPTTEGGLRADVLYVSRIDLKLYTVDLHFHPSASR